MLDSAKPLWMPDGSVRSIIALAIVTAYIFGQVEMEVLLLVLGFYFGSRTSQQSQ